MKPSAIIREKGFSKVEKRADRETGAGVIQSYLHNGRIGVLLNLRAETDFVVRSEPFQDIGARANHADRRVGPERRGWSFWHSLILKMNRRP